MCSGPSAPGDSAIVISRVGTMPLEANKTWCLSLETLTTKTTTIWLFKVYLYEKNIIYTFLREQGNVNFNSGTRFE